MVSSSDRRDYRKVFDVEATNRLLASGITPASPAGRAMIKNQKETLRNIRAGDARTRRRGEATERTKERALNATLARVRSGQAQSRLRTLRRQRGKEATRRVNVGTPGGTDDVADFIQYDLMVG